MIKHVVFRADSSVTMGAGHIMRCLTLARGLRERGAECHFICRELPGHVSNAILEANFKLTLLPSPAGPTPAGPPAHACLAGVDWQQDAQETLSVFEASAPDWLVLDHYAFDERWEAVVCPSESKLLVIDDLADREHLADLLLDQNLGRLAADYDDFLPDHATRLIGPEFALLRLEFALARPASLKRRIEPILHHIMISMGGTDSQNATGQVLDVLAKSELPEIATITVVMGSSAPFLASIQERATSMPVFTTVSVDVKDMAGLMTDTDLAIGGAGSTSWERCCLGVPTLLLSIADNQIPSAIALDGVEAGEYLGDIRNSKWQRALTAAIARCNTDPNWLDNMSKRAATLCDGEGTARVVKSIFAGM